MSAWKGKPCHTCGKVKGPNQLADKHCYRCGLAAKKAAKVRAHRARVSRVYGIRPEDYDRLYEAQGGRCALCRRATGKTRRLAVDHNHTTGEVRGLLCRPCNSILAHARDDPEYFERARCYLIEPPARDVLGNE